MSPPAEKLTMSRASQLSTHIQVMGDRSPKSTQKKAGQKEAKATSAAKKKTEAVASKQAVAKKK
jgi:hypothetical protein